MIRHLYNWTMRLGASRHAVWALALIAFIESSVFPIDGAILIEGAVLNHPLDPPGLPRDVSLTCTRSKAARVPGQDRQEWEHRSALPV
jgi:membrane protein YqaA with SNARE-associated domain